MRCFRKNIELASNSAFFLNAEFLELNVFANMELEWSCKNGRGAVPNTPIISNAVILLEQR